MHIRFSTIFPCQVLSAAILSICFNFAYADDYSIQTDRPGLVNSSKVVGKGVVQLETSYSRETDHSDGQKSRTWSTPTLIRIGTAEDWELRLETDGRIGERISNDATGETASQHGYGDMSLGAKWHMQDQDGIMPAAAWFLQADIDTGSSAFRGKGVRPSLDLGMEWELGNEFSLGIMPGVIFDKTDEGKRFTAGIFGVSLTKALSERINTFIELAAPQIARAKYGGSYVTYDAGASYLLNKDCQVDFMVHKAANRNTPDWAWEVGLSVRFK